MKSDTGKKFFKDPSAEQSERIQSLEDKRIQHPLLNKAMSLVSQGMHFPKGASTIYLYGPPGVGKTTLLRDISEKIEPTELLYMLVKSSETTIFSWIDFHNRLLRALDIRTTQRINYEEMNIRRRGDGSLRVDSKTTSISDVRLAVMKAMTYTRVSTYIFDEIPHIKKGRSEYRIADQMDALKSFIDEAVFELEKVDIVPVFVLAGTYELLEMMSVNGQLGRRSIKVHLPRYSLQDKTHIAAFKKAITAFEAVMDLQIRPNLLSKFEYLYIYSCGCIGTLKQWLYRAYSAAVMDNAQTVTDKHLKDTALDMADVQRISSEIAEGERKVKELQGNLSTIYMNLGVPTEYIANMNTFLEPSKTVSHKEGE